MGLIYNNRKEVIDFDPGCPIFVDGMNCANFQGQEFPFKEVDVTRMTDLSNFFKDCTYLRKTPLVKGFKEAYDGLFWGCENLVDIRLTPAADGIVTLYTLPSLAITLAENILNLSEEGLFLNFKNPIGDIVRVLYVPNETYDIMKSLEFNKINGKWVYADLAEGEINFKDYLETKKWLFAG